MMDTQSGPFLLCPAAEELASLGCSFAGGPKGPRLDSHEPPIPTELAHRLFLDHCRGGLVSVSSHLCLSSEAPPGQSCHQKMLEDSWCLESMP